MAPITYYYLFSIITAAGPLLWIANIVYLKTKGRTTFGQAYVVGSPEHKHIMRIARGKNLVITIIIALLALANLAWSIITVLRVNTPSARQLLVAAPIVLLIAGIFGIAKLRKEYQTTIPTEGERKKTVRKHSKGKDDSWLS